MDHPTLPFELSKEAFELGGARQVGEGTANAQFLVAVGAGEEIEERTAEARAEHLAGQEESRMTNADPARAIGGEPASGDQAMQVDMRTDLLAPGMEHG